MMSRYLIFIKRNISVTGSIIFLILVFNLLARNSYCQDWTHFVRTSGHGVNLQNISRIMNDAQKTYLFGIEIDNDIPGRYESFLQPETKLRVIKAMADSTHAHGNRAFVYVAGLECITANSDTARHTFFKDHPDWVQRNLKGEPAIFSSKDAFWISKGDEDIWISPYAPGWRKIYMERMRQIAATGIDGIYMDIPYWMTHFEGWEDTWASFDKYTVAAFKKETGIDALKSIKLGNWEDPNFIKWVKFREKSITEFIQETNKNVKSVNPECKLILEIYPGVGEAVARVGADNYQLSQVCDVITHEFNPGDDVNGDGGNSARSKPLSWMNYMIGMLTFRAIAQNNPTWMLSYSWDGEKKIQPSDAMKNLFMSQVVAGANPWDASRFVMSGSNDYDARAQIYKWLKNNETLIYNPRKSIAKIGVYFSPDTRDLFSKEWKNSYFGMLYALMINHVDFEIVTPRSVSTMNCKVLILSDVKCLSNDELDNLKTWIKKGKILITTGESGYYNQNRERKKEESWLGNLFHNFPGYLNFKTTPEKGFYQLMENEYNASLEKGQEATIENSEMRMFIEKIESLDSPEVNFKGCFGCISSVKETDDGSTMVYLMNVRGLNGIESAIPDPARNIELVFNHYHKGSDSVSFIPFTGKPMTIKGEIENTKLRIKLPVFLRGAIIIIKNDK